MNTSNITSQVDLLDFTTNQSTSATGFQVIPKELENSKVLDVVVYSLLFIIGAPANYRVLSNLLANSSYKKSRHHLLLLNLAIADCIVSFLMIPTEIGWSLTNAWLAGNVGCKMFQFLRVFGPYSSSAVLITISVDRYLAVTDPFNYGQLDNRISKLLVTSWTFSILLSLPQVLLFRVRPHPKYTWFVQCVMFDAFHSEWLETAYNVTSLVVLYFAPLLVIIFCYSRICWDSFKRTSAAASQPARASLSISRGPEEPSKQMVELEATSTNGTSTSTRVASVSNTAADSQVARQRTLRMGILKQTLVIVLAFVVCWTPYVFVTLWYQIDKVSAKNANRVLVNCLFMFAVSNSTINPFIYGKFTNPPRSSIWFEVGRSQYWNGLGTVRQQLSTRRDKNRSIDHGAD